MRKDIDLRHEAVPRPLDQSDDSRLLPEPLPMRGMFSFRYSCTEVFAQDGNMHVRMKQTHYQDGRLRTEECEGTLDRQAAERMLFQAQQQFLAQAFGFARLLLAPFISRPPRRD